MLLLIYALVKAPDDGWGSGQTIGELAGALITASFQVGVALGLAILSALATARTNSLLSAHRAVPNVLVGGYTRALLAATFFVGAVVPIGLRAANTKGEPPSGTRADNVPRLSHPQAFQARTSKKTPWPTGLPPPRAAPPAARGGERIPCK